MLPACFIVKLYNALKKDRCQVGGNKIIIGGQIDRYRQQALASRHGCKTMLLTREDLKKHTRLHHMDSLIEYAVLQYPMLRPEYLKEKESKTHYHTKMFEAVVAADLCMVNVR